MTLLLQSKAAAFFLAINWVSGSRALSMSDQAAVNVFEGQWMSWSGYM